MPHTHMVTCRTFRGGVCDCQPPSPALPDSTLREQVAWICRTGGLNVDGKQDGDIMADELLALFARVSAEAEKRGAAKGWDAGFEAGGRFALSRGSQEPLNPYTLTTETEQ